MGQKTVLTFSELKAAVEDADTTLVVLGADITFSGGIRIPPAKTVLTVDGGGFTVTDNNSSAYTDALYVPSGTGERTVTVKNVVWSGRNYYGIICVYDDAANANVTTVLENVTYRGPQAIYHRYGTVKVQNSTFYIEKNGASASAQEFGECNRIVFSGNSAVISQTTANAVIWFPFAGAAFTVEEDAALTISAPGTYLFYTDSAAKPKLTFGARSTTDITVKSGMFYASGTGAHIASAVTVEENASFSVRSEANNGVPVLKCSGALTVKSGASFQIVLPAAGSSPLLYFSASAEVNFQNPKNLLLYNGGGKVFSFATGSAASPNVVSLAAGQVNLWTAARTPYASAGGFDDPPLIALKKADGTAVTVTEKLSRTAPLSVESNLAAGDDGYPLTADGWNLLTSSVLSAGSLPLSLKRTTDLSAFLAGKTEAGAAVKCLYEGQTTVGTAGEQGDFSLELSQKPAVGSTITAYANRLFLTEKMTQTVSGSVSVTRLPDIPFPAVAVPYAAAKVRRIDPDWYLELTDTRPSGGAYALYLSLEKQLQSGEDVIPNAVHFADGGQQAEVGEELLLVKQGETTGVGTIRVFWEEAEGVLLQLDPAAVYAKGNYAAKLKWSVDFE